MHNRILIVLFTLFVVITQAMAQKRQVQHRPYIDLRNFHYGFYVGLHDQGLHLRNSGYIVSDTGEQWVGENDQQNMGFNVGILTDWRLNNTFSIRFTPGLYFSSKHIRFNRLDKEEHKTQDMKNCYVALPVYIKTAAPRFNNYRPYILTGVAPMYDLITSNHTLIRTHPLSFSLELGLGCDLYLPYFKFIPELKFSFGLGNLLNSKRKDLRDDKQRIFTQSVSKVTTNMITLSFYFE